MGWFTAGPDAAPKTGPARVPCNSAAMDAHAVRMTKYEALAQDIERLVAGGTLVPGERLPSVREMAASRGISRATVFQAYYLLEARGIIDARSRSGYFVNGVPHPREQP